MLSREGPSERLSRAVAARTSETTVRQYADSLCIYMKQSDQWNLLDWLETLYICVCSQVWSFPCHLYYITFAKYHCSSLYNVLFDAIIFLVLYFGISHSEVLWCWSYTRRTFVLPRDLHYVLMVTIPKCVSNSGFLGQRSTPFTGDYHAFFFELAIHKVVYQISLWDFHPQRAYPIWTWIQYGLH
jgi:hypothetical protein